MIQSKDFRIKTGIPFFEVLCSRFKEDDVLRIREVYGILRSFVIRVPSVHRGLVPPHPPLPVASVCDGYAPRVR